MCLTESMGIYAPAMMLFCRVNDQGVDTQSSALFTDMARCVSLKKTDVGFCPGVDKHDQRHSITVVNRPCLSALV